MRLARLFLAVLLGAAPALAAGRQQRFLPPGEVYRHALSGLGIPAALPGTPPRGPLTILEPDLDESLRYDSDDGTEAVTLFIYRNVAGSVPLWVDRAAQQILSRDIYGGPTPLGPPQPFTPPGQASASGMMQIFSVAKPPYRSTGVALLPLGRDWYVKLRYSSARIAAEELAAKMLAILAALEWPKAIAPAPAAAPIADCATPLAAKAGARPREQDLLASVLMQSVARDAAEGAAKDAQPAAPAAVFCRDPIARPALGNAGVYRAGGAADAYLIAFTDAGRGVVAAPDTLGALLGKKARLDFSVTLVDLGQSYVYAPRDRLPPPEELLAIINGEKPVSSVSTKGKGGDITISDKLLK